MNKLFAIWRSVARLFAMFIIGVMLWTLAKFGWQVLNVTGAGVNRAVQVFYVAAAALFIAFCLQDIYDMLVDIARMNAEAWKKEKQVEEPLPVPPKAQPPRSRPPPPEAPKMDEPEFEYDDKGGNLYEQ